MKKDWPLPLPQSGALPPWQSSLIGNQRLEAGDPQLNENALRTRMTPTGLPEQDLLASLNYLDAEGLQNFSGFGPRVAEIIVEWRSEKGYIASLDDLIEVPLIGQKRFEALVGRPCQSMDKALHHLLRLGWTETIRENHLRPWHEPARGLERVFLGDASDQAGERALAREKGWNLRERGVFRRRLYFHFHPTLSSGRAKFLYRRLPSLLRAAYQQIHTLSNT
ncbi:MAG: helix-hairpin-helix domain-containing protein [Opitutales bacterium]|nr:helix-hairpin-helix domain-containing protein [Opitutales bacterium]